jgi:hypothetical protein
MPSTTLRITSRTWCDVRPKPPRCGAACAGMTGGALTQASVMATKGWTLVDVRLKEQFDAQHAEGSVSVPLFRYVEGDSKWDKLKRLAMASFAMQATGPLLRRHLPCISLAGHGPTAALPGWPPLRSCHKRGRPLTAANRADPL